MIDDKEIKHARTVISECIRVGDIKKPAEGETQFFMSKADQALLTAECLMRISDNPDMKKTLLLPIGFDSYMWVINASYYAMFYSATSLLSFHGKKIKSEQGIHTRTYQALIYYFLDNSKKLEKHILEHYHDAVNDVSELLQAREEAKTQIENVKYELEKRKIFTYNMGVSAEKSKANTSITRAKEFLTLVKEMTI